MYVPVASASYSMYESCSRSGSQSGLKTKTAAVFDAREPDSGCMLDLATPADRQVSQLDKCSQLDKYVFVAS